MFVIFRDEFLSAFHPFRKRASEESRSVEDLIFFLVSKFFFFLFFSSIRRVYHKKNFNHYENN